MECQQARTQGENREKAMAMLKSRLYEEEMRKREAIKECKQCNKEKNRVGKPDTHLMFFILIK